MNKAIIFVGELEGREEYQLLIGTDYVSSSYNEAESNREDFLEEISGEFARRIIEKNEFLEVGIVNGQIMINGELNKVGKLDSKSLEIKLTDILKQSFGGARA